MYSSTITIRECNKKTLAQNRKKRDKCGENGREAPVAGEEDKGANGAASAAAKAAAKAARVTRGTKISRFLVLN